MVEDCIADYEHVAASKNPASAILIYPIAAVQGQIRIADDCRGIDAGGRELDPVAGVGVNRIRLDGCLAGIDNIQAVPAVVVRNVVVDMHIPGTGKKDSR